MSKTISGISRIVATVLIFSICSVFASIGQVRHVEVKKNANQEFRMYVDQQEFYVKGVGGSDFLDVAVKIGANTIRTWSTNMA